MSQSYGKLAQRYARALFRAVTEQGGESGSTGLTPAQQVAKKLSALSQLWLENDSLSGAVVNPMFEQSQRLAALTEVTKLAQLPDIAQRFVRLVFERDRILALPQIADAFAELADVAAGLVPVDITVAQELGDQERSEVESSLRKKIPGNLALTWKTDKTILGGMIVSYGGKIVDGSVKGRLERVERQLLA